MSTFFGINNPGIGGLDELTTAEELVVQQIAGLGDPNADRILFWDDSASSYGFLTAGTGLTITGTTISSSAGTGNVSKVGIPVDNQIGVWTGDGTLEGSTSLTFDGTQLATTGNILTSTLYGSSVDNGNIRIEGTSSALKTTSYVNLQPNGGNVGIGTTSPSGKLQVTEFSTNYPLILDQTVAFSGASGRKSATLYQVNGATMGFTGFQDSSNYGSDLISYSTNGQRFFTGGTNERMRIDSAGNVGIGTTTPAFKLDVSSGNDGTVGLRVAGTAIDSKLSPSTLSLNNSLGSTNGSTIGGTAGQLTYNSSANGHIWQIGGTEKMRMDSTGNVGIGTSSPNYGGTGTFLSIENGTVAPGIDLYLNKAGVVGTMVGAVKFWGQNTTSTRYELGRIATLNGLSASSAGQLVFSAANSGGSLTERMRINESGNVGIGTTTPSSKLSINGGLHVGGDSDAGDNNILADGTITGSNLSGTNTGDQTISIGGDVTAAGSTGILSSTVTKINGTSLAGLATGILKNTTTTGVPSIAVAGDFPTLNQNTTGSAATLTTTRTIWGQNFNGSANVIGDLALGVSSLTLTGSIGATGARATKVWTIDSESTNMPTVGGTSLSSTFQATLVSGTNIKTVNGSTLLGSGDLVVSGGITWTTTTVDATMSVGNGYIANKGTLLTMTLPTTSAVGTTVRIAGMNAGLWKIAQATSQYIKFGNQATTAGVTGSLASVLTYDAVELVCIEANLGWMVVSSVGNITVV